MVLSQAFLSGSAYGAAEWQAAFAQDPQGLERRLIPVRVETCERPGLLKAITGFDLFGLDEAAANARLLQQIKATVSGSAKPTTKPAFPGRPLRPELRSLATSLGSGMCRRGTRTSPGGSGS